MRAAAPVVGRDLELARHAFGQVKLNGSEKIAAWMRASLLFSAERVLESPRSTAAGRRELHPQAGAT